MDDVLKIIFNEILKIINKFPKTKRGQKPYLKLKNGKKVFFRIFLKKYGINNQKKCKYSSNDILRRIRIFEFIGYILQNYDLKFEKNKKGYNTYVIETHFYRIIFLEKRVGYHKYLELLSIYPYIKKTPLD